jgi:hypothetical protein
VLVRRHTGPAITIAACLWCVVWASSAPAAPTPGGESPRAATAPAVKSVVVVLEDQGVVPPGATRGFTRVCPKRAPHPVGGTFGPGEGSPRAGQFLLAASFPQSEKRAWRVVVKNITPLPQPFFAGAVCIGAPGPVVYVQTTGVAPPGMDAGADLRCPASAPRGIGGFFRPQQASATGLIVADGSFRTSAGWDVGIRNVGDIPSQSVPPAPQGYRVGAVCAGKGLRTAVVSRVRTVPGGRAVDTTLRCPLRTPQPLTGVFAAADAGAAGQILATGEFRTGARTWNSGVRNVSSAPQRGGVGVVCVR